MADQDYPTLYADLEASAQRTRTAAIAFEKVLGGTETDLVPVNGYGNQPTLAGRVKVRMDQLMSSISSAVEGINRFAGVTATAPTTRTDGSALRVGDEYQNTSTGLRYSWSGTSWVALNASVQQLTSQLAASDGATKVGYGTGTVKTALDALGSSVTDVLTALGKANFTAVNMAALRALKKTSPGGSVALLGYNSPNDGGAGRFYYDSTDTTSADNGGTIIVATDGGRWKRASTNDLNVLHFGAVAGGVQDCSPAVNAMIAAGIRRIVYPVGVFFQASTINLPQTSDLEFVGAGFRLTLVQGNGSAGYPLFSYQRAAGTGGSVVVWRDMGLKWAGTPKLSGSAGIKYYGYSDALSDNWFRTERCAFYLFEIGRRGKWAGQVHSTDDYFQANKYSNYMERGASQWYYNNCMSFDSTFIFATDDIADAFSNGITIQNCASVGATMESIFAKNWQLISIDGCGFDGGSGGTAAAYFLGCQDVFISKSFISSDISTTRQGVRFEGSHSSVVQACTIVNNSIGVCILGVNGLATKIVIDSNKLDGNATNDVLLTNYARGCKIINNHFGKQMSRTGANYEVYGSTTGTDYNIVGFNTFAGVYYALAAGSNSLITGNMFNTGT